jgi:hypothetical protein
VRRVGFGGAAAEQVNDEFTGFSLPSLVTVPDVDLLAAGTWELSTGRQTFTRADLESAIEAAACPAIGAPVIKIGHLDDRFKPGPGQDGEPAIGRVTNMRITPGGDKITGDLSGMPGWLAAVTASAFPNRSVEGTYNFTCQIGHSHPFVITGLALLGVTPPGIGVLRELPDIAKLYGLQAAASPATGWRTGAIETKGGTAMAVTEEDVRRAYYAQERTPKTWWITEMQMSPTQLILSDGDGGIYLVPFEVAGSAVSFGEPVRLETYEAVTASRSTGATITYASAAESRDVAEEDVEAAWDAGTHEGNLGGEGDATQEHLNAMYALPGSTQTDSKLPHHNVNEDGSVGDANMDGCSAAIGALNGARGGMTGVSPSAAKKAYSHLAAHMRAAGMEPPSFKGAGSKAASAIHPPAGTADDPVTHSHAHPTFGTADGETHTHEHTHSGDNSHRGKAHAQPASAGAGNDRKGGSTVEFTDEQLASLRTYLGLEDAEADEFGDLDPDEVFAAIGALKEKADAPGKVAATRPLPKGVMIVEREAWESLQKRVEQGEEFRARKSREERDDVIGAAIRSGKFSKAREVHWARLWDKDPEGTREVIAGLTPNVVPTKDIGSPGMGDEDLLDEEYLALFPPNRKP